MIRLLREMSFIIDFARLQFPRVRKYVAFSTVSFPMHELSVNKLCLEWITRSRRTLRAHEHAAVGAEFIHEADMQLNESQKNAPNCSPSEAIQSLPY